MFAQPKKSEMIHQPNFYESIPAISNITEISNPKNYYPIPSDWYIALTDVKGSTKAIEAGKYKDVNVIAAATITAMLNLSPGNDLPFVFGGDGATVLIPPEAVPKARDALLVSQSIAKNAFDLDLRVGIVPVIDVLREGQQIRVGRLTMSENFQQAIFIGGGMSHAETLLKDPTVNEKYLVTGEADPQNADFSGLECRWHKVPSRHDEIISLIVMATDEFLDHSLIYREVLEKILTIYGDRPSRHPIGMEDLQLKTLPGAFKTEAIVKHQDTNWRRIFKMAWNTFLARMAMWLNIGQWGSYKRLLVEATDHEKFDDMLRMVISSTDEQRDALRAYLEEKRLQGMLVYGTHSSQHSLITCVVFDYFGRQVHFVDGADGGYALAAKEMKTQLAELKTRAKTA